MCSGELSLDEFIEGIQADEVLSMMLTQSLDLTHIVSNIYTDIDSDPRPARDQGAKRDEDDERFSTLNSFKPSQY